MILLTILIILQTIVLIAIVYFITRLHTITKAFDKILYNFISVNQNFYNSQHNLAYRLSNAAEILAKDRSTVIASLQTINKVMTDNATIVKDIPVKLQKIATDMKNNIDQLKNDKKQQPQPKIPDVKKQS